ncbi:MAG: helix-turn-helix transcriptional regulator [Pseudomonadota bacterium]
MAERIRHAEGPLDGPDDLKQLRRDLGAWLKSRREAAGLTQADLAERLGLKYYSFISQVENGVGRIPQDIYPIWAEALCVPPREFAETVIRHLEPGLSRMLEHDEARSDEI